MHLRSDGVGRRKVGIVCGKGLVGRRGLVSGGEFANADAGESMSDHLIILETERLCLRRLQSLDISALVDLLRWGKVWDLRWMRY